MAYRITGTCWSVTYEGKTVIVTVIDRATDGYSLSKGAVNTLTCVDFDPCPTRTCLLTRTVVTARPKD